MKPEDPSQQAENPYSVFSPAAKWCIVSLVAYGSLFSTLSSFIYFPAIPSMSKSLSVTIENINWTITSYMAVATIAPTLVGDAADVVGRRPVYVVILSLYIAANVGIAGSETYSALVGLRVVQALAISGTFCITYGVIADIASPAERGSFVSLVAFATTAAPTFGPVLGGALTYAAGWTWIFWFLSIASGLCLALMVFFLPETARNIVDNGSIPPPKLLQLPIHFPTFSPGCSYHQESDSSQATIQSHKWRIPNPFQSLMILVRKDNLVVITACGLLYVVYTCVNTALSVLFVDIYALNQWQTGLIYLPFGLGGIASTLFSGRLINTAYRKARLKRGLTTDRASGADLDSFPVERARLSVIWAPLLLTSSSVLAFGWVLHYRKHIAIPLTLQFVIGLVMQLDFMIYNTLLTDKNQRNPAAAQASSNIVRCGLAAIVVAFLQDIFKTLGIGWTFTFMSALCLVCVVLFAIDYTWGFTWRQNALANTKPICTASRSHDTPQASHKP